MIGSAAAAGAGILGVADDPIEEDQLGDPLGMPERIPDGDGGSSGLTEPYVSH